MTIQLQNGTLLDVAKAEGVAILKLFASEAEHLLAPEALVVLDLRLDFSNGVGCLDIECDCLCSQGLCEYPHPSSQTQNQV